MGSKTKHNLNSFINESLYKTTNPNITTTAKTLNNNTSLKSNQSDKIIQIKKQLINNEIANFTGFHVLGEDGLKIISEFINSNLNNTYNNSSLSIINNDHNINLSPNTLSSSLTLGNINTPISNQTSQVSQTPNNSTKKNVKFSEELMVNNSNKKSINTPALAIQKNCNYNELQKYKLKEIRLIKCNIADEGFAILAGCVDKTGSIQVLNLKGNKIKDKSVKNILNIIKKNKTLKHLVLTQNLFTQTKKENIKINARLLNPNLKLEI